MDYSRPALADRLAAEYVLGTLRGPARRRLRALLPAHPALRQAVTLWRMRLMPLSVSVPEVQPGPAAWSGIERRLFGAAADSSLTNAHGPAHSAAAPAAPGGTTTSHSSSFGWSGHIGDAHDSGITSSLEAQPSHLSDLHNTMPIKPRPAAATHERPARRGRRDDLAQRWWQAAGLWQGLTGVASLTALGLAVLLNQPVPVQPPLLIVMQASPESSSGLQPARFVASVSADGRALVLRPLDAVPISASQALELWALPPGGMGSPRSLGVVSAQQTTTVLRTRLLTDTVGFAVSLEPSGGSPTGQPTGPILSVGKLSS
jgi:anti-sigma-K factor RskA